MRCSCFHWSSRCYLNLFKWYLRTWSSGFTQIYGSYRSSAAVIKAKELGTNKCLYKKAPVSPSLQKTQVWKMDGVPLRPMLHFFLFESQSNSPQQCCQGINKCLKNQTDFCVAWLCQAPCQLLDQGYAWLFPWWRWSWPYSPAVANCRACSSCLEGEERRGEEGHERTKVALGCLHAHFKLLKKPAFCKVWMYDTMPFL